MTVWNEPKLLRLAFVAGELGNPFRRNYILLEDGAPKTVVVGRYDALVLRVRVLRTRF
jgi:hypothetical protein